MTNGADETHTHTPTEREREREKELRRASQSFSDRCLDPALPLRSARSLLSLDLSREARPEGPGTVNQGVSTAIQWP